MQRQRLHFGILLERSPSPSGDIRVPGAVDDHLRLHGDQPVFVRQCHRLNATSAGVSLAKKRVEQHAQFRRLLLKQLVEQPLELKRVGDRRIVLRNLLRVGSTDSRLRQQFDRNTAHDDAVVTNVGDPIEVRQPNAGDDPTGKRSLLDQQHLGPTPRGTQRRRAPRTASAANEHIGRQRPSRSSGMPTLRHRRHGRCGGHRCGRLNEAATSLRIVSHQIPLVPIGPSRSRRKFSCRRIVATTGSHRDCRRARHGCVDRLPCHLSGASCGEVVARLGPLLRRPQTSVLPALLAVLSGKG